VAASDIPVQLPQLRANLEAFRADEQARTGAAPPAAAVLPYYWGEDPAALRPADGKPYDVCIASDIVFIALRDKREKELSATLRGLLSAGVCRRLVFGFEERLCDEEEAFVCALEAECSAWMELTELRGGHVSYDFDEALQGAGGHPDTALWNPRLFWECPPMRIFVLRVRQGAAAPGVGADAVPTPAVAAPTPAVAAPSSPPVPISDLCRLAYESESHDPLMQAIDSSATAAADAILKRDEDGRSTLQWAAAGAKEDSVAYLLGLARTVHAAAAREGGAGGAVEARMQAAFVNGTDAEGWTALHSAASAGSVACVGRLLSAGGDPLARTAAGATPLHYHKGRAAVVDALLRSLPDAAAASQAANAADRGGSTALHRAAGPGFVEAARALLRRGADPLLLDRVGGNSALHLACDEGRPEVVRLILEHLQESRGRSGWGPRDLQALLETKNREGASVFDLAVAADRRMRSEGPASVVGVIKAAVADVTE
jgi:hypothetical protein